MISLFLLLKTTFSTSYQLFEHFSINYPQYIFLYPQCNNEKSIRSMAISGTDWLEVRTIYKAFFKAYFLGLCKGISLENIAKYMVLTYLHVRILEFRLNI